MSLSSVNIFFFCREPLSKHFIYSLSSKKKMSNRLRYSLKGSLKDIFRFAVFWTIVLVFAQLHEF